VKLFSPVTRFHFAMNKRSRFFVVVVGILFALITQSFAGIKWVDIGVDGLTCSMCSRSVEMSIRRLDFVEKVEMSLETTEGRIYFKNDTPINLAELAKAVVNAGFSVRFVKLEWDFSDIPIAADGSFVFQGQTYRWLDYSSNTPGQVALKLVDDNFLPKKESNEWKKKLSQEGIPQKEKVLHVIQHG
jgi:copper chaperone CopZ